MTRFLSRAFLAVFWGIALIQTVCAADPPLSGTVAPVRLERDQKTIGSAIRVCLDPKFYENDLNRTVGGKWSPSYLKTAAARDRDWWIVPAHVVNGRALEIDLGGVWAHIALEMVDASMDLVLFWTPKAEEGSACFPLARELGNVPYFSPNFYEHPSKTWTDLRVEALFDQAMNHQTLSTRQPLSAIKGFPGREGISDLLQVWPKGKFRSEPGISGGAVSGFVRDGKVVEYAPENDRRLMGMIIAQSQEAIGALPSPLIFRRIVEHLRRGIPKVKFDRLSVPGGVQYTSRGATYFRVGGTGGLGDGGLDMGVDPGKEQRSGLWAGGKLWKYLVLDKTNWIVGEPLPDSIFAALEYPSRLQGIYFENGRYFATDMDFEWPSSLDARVAPERKFESKPGIRCQENWAEIADSKNLALRTRDLVWGCEVSSSERNQTFLLVPKPSSRQGSVHGSYLVWMFENARVKTGPSEIQVERKAGIYAIDLQSLPQSNADGFSAVLGCMTEPDRCAGEIDQVGSQEPVDWEQYKYNEVIRNMSRSNGFWGFVGLENQQYVRVSGALISPQGALSYPKGLQAFPK